MQSAYGSVYFTGVPKGSRHFKCDQGPPVVQIAGNAVFVLAARIDVDFHLRFFRYNLNHPLPRKYFPHFYYLDRLGTTNQQLKHTNIIPIQSESSGHSCQIRAPKLTFQTNRV